MLHFWEETRLRKVQPHTMVNLQGRFKGETGGKWHMLPMLDDKNLGIQVKRWVGRWLEVIVGEDKRLEGWVFQREKGEGIKIQDLDKELQEGLRGLQDNGSDNGSSRR